MFLGNESDLPLVQVLSNTPFFELGLVGLLAVVYCQRVAEELQGTCVNRPWPKPIFMVQGVHGVSKRHLLLYIEFVNDGAFLLPLT